jgi:hypothetical protein
MHSADRAEGLIDIGQGVATIFAGELEMAPGHSSPRDVNTGQIREELGPRSPFRGSPQSGLIGSDWRRRGDGGRLTSSAPSGDRGGGEFSPGAGIWMAVSFSVACGRPYSATCLSDQPARRTRFWAHASCNAGPRRRPRRSRSQSLLDKTTEAVSPSFRRASRSSTLSPGMNVFVSCLPSSRTDSGHGPHSLGVARSARVIARLRVAPRKVAGMASLVSAKHCLY